MAAILPFILRNWQAAIGVVVSLSLLILLAIRTDQRNDARGERDAAVAQVATLTGHVERQNAAIANLERAGQEARARSERALAEAQAVNRRDQSTIDSLRRSGARVRGPNEACTVSEELRNAQGL